jgi:cytoskeletal protein CcmA (bactofilin family)
MRMIGAWMVLVMLTGPAYGQETGRAVVKQGPIREDLYMAGEHVQALGEMGGDVVVAGGKIGIDGQVSQDILAAGGAIDIRGSVGDDVRAAGGDVTLAAAVAGDVVVAAGSIALGAGTRIGGHSWLAGGDIEVAADVGRELRAAAGTLLISGVVQGDAEVVTGELVLLPTARIEGNLTYRSPQQATIHPGAQVLGKTVYIPVERPGALTRTHAAALFGLVVLSLTVTGLVLYLLLPSFTVGAARTLRTAPWKSLGLGLVVLLVAPFVALMLMATLLGMPLGLIVLALYVVSLLAGLLIAAFALGELIAYPLCRGRRMSGGWRMVSLFLAVLVLVLLPFIPAVGGLLLFLALLFGLGAWTLRAYRARTAPAAAATS